MTPDLLAQCGQALYGPAWQSALARDLGVSDRTVRRWVAGSSAAPRGINAELLRLIRQRAVDLRVIEASIHRLEWVKRQSARPPVPPTPPPSPRRP